MLTRLIRREPKAERVWLRPPYRSDGGHAWMAAAPWTLPRRTGGWCDGLTTCLYEDGVRLLEANAPHETIRVRGLGAYSHLNRRVWFSSSDNTDPNTNGRRYEVDFTLDWISWRQSLLQSMTALWDLHPEGAYFRAQGGDEIPPPVVCNLGLTNKCNLRCEICGSQKYLDATGVLRRHMAIERVEAVARTLFPVVAVVELNSQGDPLLHPQIERVIELIAAHRCEVKVQTNGTLFSERVIELLAQQTGTVMLSLDAVGPRFDEVRRGGVWERARPGLERFVARRNPASLRVGVYPTVTRRTLSDALEIVQWAHDHDLDEAAFHRYVPIQNSFEEAPEADELRALGEQLRDWAAAHDPVMKITLDGNVLVPGGPPRRTLVADPVRHRLASFIAALMAPMEREMADADPVMICAAPNHYVEVGLEGQVSACCRAQDVPLGFATSPQAFARAWFGRNYRAIRGSLRRDATGPLPLPNCEPCIAGFAPHSLGGRRAVDYGGGAAAPARLDYDDCEEWRLEGVQRETGHCYIAMLAPGLRLTNYRLSEDGCELGPPDSLHDDIRTLGGGRYSVWGRTVYFSTSDNTDPRHNGRTYMFERDRG